MTEWLVPRSFALLGRRAGAGAGAGADADAVVGSSIFMTVVVVERCSLRNSRMEKQLQKSPSTNPKIANWRSIAKKPRM